MAFYLFVLRAGLWTQSAQGVRRVRQTLRKGSARVCPSQKGLSRAMGTRGQAEPGYAHASHLFSLQEGYFQPLRSAGEVTLQRKSDTTQALLKSSSHHYNPRRSLHRRVGLCGPDPLGMPGHSRITATSTTGTGTALAYPLHTPRQLPARGALSNSFHGFKVISISFQGFRAKGL